MELQLEFKPRDSNMECMCCNLWLTALPNACFYSILKQLATISTIIIWSLVQGNIYQLTLHPSWNGCYMILPQCWQEVNPQRHMLIELRRRKFNLTMVFRGGVFGEDLGLDMVMLVETPGFKKNRLKCTCILHVPCHEMPCKRGTRRLFLEWSRSQHQVLEPPKWWAKYTTLLYKAASWGWRCGIVG